LAALNTLSGSAQAGAIHMPVRGPDNKDSHCKGLIAESHKGSRQRHLFQPVPSGLEHVSNYNTPVVALRMIRQ